MEKGRGGVVDGFKWMVLWERGKLPMVLTRGIHRKRENNRLDLGFDRWEQKGFGENWEQETGYCTGSSFVLFESSRGCTRRNYELRSGILRRAHLLQI